MTARSAPHRGTIFLEDAEVLAHERFEGNQFILKLRAPKCARSATAGSFVHLSCDDSLPMRRPLSIMRANAERETIEVLYKIVGPGSSCCRGSDPAIASAASGRSATASCRTRNEPRTCWWAAASASRR